MDIQKWFDTNGSYAAGVQLYAGLPNCNKTTLRAFARENTANFLKLKYELKKALLTGATATVTETKKTPQQSPEHSKTEANKALLQEIIKESVAHSFEKETMAMYPMELHQTYRERVSNWYQACELKFKLNACADDDEVTALQLIIQLEDLWTRIDRAWTILNHYKAHNRIMPTKEDEDFSNYSKDKLFVMRNRLETRVSKRTKTLQAKKEAVERAPEDRTLLNAYNRKLEQLHQLEINLQTIRKLLKDE